MFIYFSYVSSCWWTAFSQEKSLPQNTASTRRTSTMPKRSFQSVSSASFSCLQHRVFQCIFPIEWFRRQFAHLKWFIYRDFVIHLRFMGDALHRNLLVDHIGICWFRWITIMSPKPGRVLCTPGEGTPSMLGDMDVLWFWSPFWHSGDGTRSFWGTFTHHQHQNDLLGY